MASLWILVHLYSESDARAHHLSFHCLTAHDVCMVVETNIVIMTPHSNFPLDVKFFTLKYIYIVTSPSNELSLQISFEKNSADSFLILSNHKSNSIEWYEWPRVHELQYMHSPCAPNAACTPPMCTYCETRVECVQRCTYTKHVYLHITIIHSDIYYAESST